MIVSTGMYGAEKKAVRLWQPSQLLSEPASTRGIISFFRTFIGDVHSDLGQPGHVISSGRGVASDKVYHNTRNFPRRVTLPKTSAVITLVRTQISMTSCKSRFLVKAISRYITFRCSRYVWQSAMCGMERLC